MSHKHKLHNTMKEQNQAAVSNSPDSKKTQQNESTMNTSGGNKSNNLRNISRRRKWSRRLLWVAAIIVMIVLVLRIALWASLPWILNKTMKGYKLQCSYEKLSFSLLTGDAELWHLTLQPEDSNESLLYIEYVRAEVSTRTLFAHQLVVPRVEIDGMDVNIVRSADGKFHQLERFLNNSQAAKKQVVSSNVLKATEAEQKEIDLTPPVKLDAMRFQNIDVAFRDESISPVLESHLDLNVSLSNIGSNKRKTRFQAILSCQPILDQILVEGTAFCLGMDLLADINLEVNGFHPQLVKNYLADLGISPYSENITAACSGQVRTKGIERLVDVKQVTTQKKKLEPIPRILNVRMDLSNIALAADETESFSLKNVIVDANVLQTNDIQINKIALSGGRADFWKDADNNFYTGGLKFVNKTGSSQVQNRTNENAINLPAGQGKTIIDNPDTATFNWSVDELNMGDLQFTFHDKSISPNTDLALVLKSLDIEHINSKNSPLSKISSELAMPGVIQAVRLEGSADILSKQKQLALKLSADGIKPDALAPYMKQASLESLYQNGRFTCDVNAAFEPGENGSLSGSASLSNILLQDESELFALDAIKLEGLFYDPNTKNTRIKNVDISGQRLAIERDENGCLRFFGLRIVKVQNQLAGVQANQNIPVQASQTAVEGAAHNLTNSIPRIQIERFSWHDNKLVFSDRAISPATSISISDFGFQLDGLDLNFSSDQVTPAKVAGWLQAPGIIENTVLSGSITTKQKGVSVKLDLDCSDLSAKELSPYMQAIGIESAITNGNLRAALDTDLDLSGAVPGCSVNLHDVVLWSNDANMVALKSMAINKLRVQDGNITIENVAIDQPYIAITREQNGNLNIAGIRLLNKEMTNTETQSQPVPRSASNVPSQTSVKISDIKIKEGELLWSDNQVTPAVSQILKTDVGIMDFSFGRDAAPSTVNINVELPDVIKKAVLSGELRLKTSQQAADLNLDVSGIKTDKLIPYFSGNLKPALADAVLKGAIKADIEQHRDGGYKIDFELDNLDYTDGSKQDSLLKFDSAKVVFDRLDPNARIMAVKEISIAGFESGGELTKPDIFSILGDDLLLGKSNSSKTITETNLPAQSQQAINNNSKKPDKLPLLSLETLNLQLKKFTFKDLTKSAIEPIILSDFQIRNTQPIKLFSEESDANSIVGIEVEGKIQPIVESLSLKTQMSPFSSKPLLHAEVDLSQINTSKLTSIMPNLANVIDSNNLSNLQFSGKTDLTLLLNNRDIFNFDSSKPFGLELLVKNIQLADSQKKTTLAGFDELNINIPRIDLNKQNIHIKEIGLVKPQGYVSMETDGLHVLGLTLKMPAKQDASNGKNTAAEKQPVTKEMETRDTGNKTADANKPEILVDQFLVNGIDFTFVDRTVNPAMYIPIKGMDVELRGFNSHQTEKTPPMRFNVIMTSGEIPIPGMDKKQNADSNNVVSSAIEQRLLFQEMSASGSMTLYPKPDGWIKAGISGMELANFRGTAGRAGVVLNKGVLDVSVDTRFKKTGTISTASQIVFTDLSLTEPPDGFLKKLLSLPTSLDTVIFILQDTDGAIRLPVSFKLDEKGISGGQLAGAALGATASLIANAVAGSPLRVAGTVTDILGVEKKEPNDAQTYVLEYAPGVTTLSGEQILQLEKIIELLKKDKKVTAAVRHELGGGDISYAGSLVNLSNSDIAELIKKLQQQKADLYQERDKLASETKAAYATDISIRSIEKMQLLQETERKIGLIERSLDDLLDRLRPGTEYAATRRTRDASVVIGKARLDAIMYFLTTKNIPDKQDRIKYIAPRFNDAQGNSGGFITIKLQKSKAS